MMLGSPFETEVVVDDFTGKVVLVTGAGQGCGRALAEDFARRGASVVVNDRNAETGAATTKRIAGSGGAATFVHADVSKEAEVAMLVDTAVKTYGRLDCAVNNAGDELTGTVADSDAGRFAALIATNLEGVRACLKQEIRVMRANGADGGAIVNMSSVTSDLTAVPENGLYAATKGGIDALTKAAAIEVAKDNISVNALAFIGADVEGGMFQRFFEMTDVPREQIMAAIPVGRMCRPEELSAAVRYLCSDDSRFVTATTMLLDGGFTAM